MKALRGTSDDGLLARVSPYVTAVCAVALLGVVVVQGTRSSAGNDDAGEWRGIVGGGPGTSTLGPGGEALPATADAGGQLATGVPGAPAAGTRRAGRGAAGTTGATGGDAAAAPGSEGGVTGAAAAAALSGSGMLTDQALANPECDRATKKVKVPTVFAPPCVVAWRDGADNGGATATGVTKDEIRIVALIPHSNTASEDDQQAVMDEILAGLDIFESHYEMWGRKLAVTFQKASGTDEVAQRADASEIYNKVKPFAAFVAGQDSYPVWATELAARGVVSITLTEQWKATQSQPGHRWGANPDDHLTWAHATEYVAKRLQGRPAQWSGSQQDKVKTRVVGVLHPESWDQESMKKQAATSGADIAIMVGYPDGDLVALQNRAPTLIARLRDAGVTTVVSAVDIVSNVVITREATNQVFTPEWVVTGWGNHDTAVAGRLFDQQQWSRAFGFGPVQPLVPDQFYDLTNLYRWHHGRDPAQPAALGWARLVSHVLMTGIHVTGPQLTPETFRNARFAAPPSGGSACGCRSTVMVSFGRHTNLPWDDYTGFDDMTEKWWDPSTTGTDEIGLTAAGVYWKVDGGKRYFPGQWPTGEPKMFSTEGAVERFSAPPPGEELPKYEHAH